MLLNTFNKDNEVGIVLLHFEKLDWTCELTWANELSSDLGRKLLPICCQYGGTTL